MNMKQTTSEFSRITRISGAAALIAFSGSALALAAAVGIHSTSREVFQINLNITI